VSWILDTNSCSHAIRGQHGLRTAIDERRIERLYITAITVAEAWTGSLRSPNRKRLLALWAAFLEPFAGRILSFDEDAAREYGAIRADLEARGEMIGDRDCMIAGIARHRRMSVVTANLDEFRRVPGLKVSDWRREATERG